jgi:endonuclease YncB( thermonuclease family)
MRVRVLRLACLALLAAPAAADWLVYQRGGVQETRGGWQVAGAQVRFHNPAGTLMAVRADEVDLAASAFLSWQVGDRRAIGATRAPAGAELGVPVGAPGPTAPAPAAPCAPAKLLAVVSPETLEVEVAGRRETVHLAGVDAPEPGHPLRELAWLGQEALTVVDRLLPQGTSLCLVDDAPALVDRAGHRVVYVRLPKGGDLGEELLTRGLALARSGGGSRRAHYESLERFALSHEVGHWGEVGHDLSVAVIAHAAEIGGASAAPPRRAAGRRS